MHRVPVRHGGAGLAAARQRRRPQLPRLSLLRRQQRCPQRTAQRAQGISQQVELNTMSKLCVQLLTMTVMVFPSTSVRG